MGMLNKNTIGRYFLEMPPINYPHILILDICYFVVNSDQQAIFSELTLIQGLLFFMVLVSI